MNCQELPSLYIIKDIEESNIILVTEDGQGSIRIQTESFALSGLEIIYDWPWLLMSSQQEM